MSFENFSSSQEVINETTVVSVDHVSMPGVYYSEARKRHGRRLSLSKELFQRKFHSESLQMKPCGDEDRAEEDSMLCSSGGEEQIKFNNNYQDNEVDEESCFGWMVGKLGTKVRKALGCKERSRGKFISNIFYRILNSFI